MQEGVEDNSLLGIPLTQDTVPEEININKAETKIFVEPSPKIMPTLPGSFKSLVDSPISLTNETRRPQLMIELLGDALGVNDYKINIASFWFLDFIALQVLRFETHLDDHSRSILVSWLAGEMKLIQEKNLSHEEFFQRMEDLFISCSEKLSLTHPIRHWDLITENNIDEIPEEQEIVLEVIKQKKTSHSKVAKRRLSSRSEHKRSSERREANENSSTKTRIHESANIIDEKLTIAEENCNNVLDIIIEATYSMYGDSFHYALIVATFVKPVILHEYVLPYKLRKPRPLKMFEVVKRDEKDHISAAPRKSKEAPTKKLKNSKSKNKSKDVEENKLILEPIPSIVLTYDEILLKKREFILPLMEANESPQLLEIYKESKARTKDTDVKKKKIIK